MNEATLKARTTQLNAMGDTNRKVWAARKKFAAECGIDVTPFSRGLGPAYERLTSIVKGIKEVESLIGADDRTFAPFLKEKKKLDAILDSYRALIPKPLTIASTGLDGYYGWKALETGLVNIARWATEAERHYAGLARRRARH